MSYVYEVIHEGCRYSNYLYSSKAKAEKHFDSVDDIKIQWLEDMAVVWNSTAACRLGEIRKRQVV